MLKVNNLAGFGVKTAEAVALSSLSFVDDATEDGGDAITAPASIDAGDLLVMLDYHVKPDGGGLPAGWTQILNLSGAYVEVTASYLIADGTEDGASITGWTGGLEGGKIIQQFRGDSPASAVTVQDVGSQLTSGNPTAQTITASGGTVPLIAFAGYGSSGAVSPRTFTPAEDGETSVSNPTIVELYLKYKIYNASPANISVDMDDEGFDNALVSFYLEVS